jgi:UDP-hydrolysing UDP-N-acetyl-D-glucosamine 2-epimerase
MNRFRRRTICFVTGTRAEFGLMVRALRAIDTHPTLRLRIVATGMHLDSTRGYSLSAIEQAGFDVAATVPWPPAGTASGTAAATGQAMAGLTDCYRRLKADVVLVVGDRVEAFAAAAAAHVAGLCVAHVHGGDRAPGVIDDSLRHAITKLSHVHFPATADSARRIRRLGEDDWRVYRVGSPGIDSIAEDALPLRTVCDEVGPLTAGAFTLFAFHPAGGSDAAERRRAAELLRTVLRVAPEPCVAVYPNNDPGSGGIVRAIEAVRDKRFIARRNLSRGTWLGLLRDAAMLVGNSSSGIIEAASFGTPVINVGDRQQGRQHGPNVFHARSARDVPPLVRHLWNGGRPRRFSRRNPYGGGPTGARIAQVLAGLSLDDALLRKFIAY